MADLLPKAPTALQPNQSRTMIVTIDDYRNISGSQSVPSNNEHIADADDDSKFTVARAGYIKLKLHALNSILIRTPIDQHKHLNLDEIVQGISPRTYVDGSEEVYFLVKDLPWPSRLPQVFIEAYREVLQSRPFTNKCIRRPFRERPVELSGKVETLFAPTFSMIRHLLPDLDTSCNTKLNGFFAQMDQNGMSMPKPSKCTLIVI